jgi:hypothetical protein
MIKMKEIQDIGDNGGLDLVMHNKQGWNTHIRTNRVWEFAHICLLMKCICLF